MKFLIAGFLFIALMATIRLALKLNYKSDVQIYIKLYSLDDADVDNEWDEFKRTFRKIYKNQTTENYRREMFKKTLRIINEQNERYNNGTSSFTFAINSFSDLTQDEFSQFVKRTSLVINDNDDDENKYKPDLGRQLLPASIDWEQLGYVAPIRNQGACGACWAYSAISALESHNYLVNKKRLNLSEQQLVDCVYKRDGCIGGWMPTAYNYIKNSGGIASLNSYPYVSGSTKTWQNCSYNSKPAVQITGYTSVTSGIGNETLVMRALAEVGPLSVAVYASPAFQYYSSGVFEDSACKDTINHAVNLIGYGTLNGKDYYKLRNSWGPNWGQGGYMLIKRDTKGNSNLCNITTHAYYPNVLLNPTTTSTTSNKITTTRSKIVSTTTTKRLIVTRAFTTIKRLAQTKTVN